MKDNIIIVGTGASAKNFYQRIKSIYSVSFFVDLEERKIPTLFEVPVISLEKLKDNIGNRDIVICDDAYYEVGNRLRECNIFDFYVFLKGFLFHTDLCETMQPCELGEYEYYKKSDDKKVVLYISQNPSERICEIAKQIKREGYTSILLYTDFQYGVFDIKKKGIFDKVFEVSNMKSVFDFVKNSEVDLIHADRNSSILFNIARLVHRPIVSEYSTVAEDDSLMRMEDIVLTNMTIEQSDAVIYISHSEKEAAELKYEVKDKPIFILNDESITTMDFGKNLAAFYERIMTENR